MEIADLPAMGTPPSQFQHGADFSNRNLHLKPSSAVFYDCAGRLHCGVCQLEAAEKLQNEEGK
jgi:hypothetical protein